MNDTNVAEIFKAFCDENRIKILKMLHTGEKCACELLEELTITQPSLSHQVNFETMSETLFNWATK